jgi:hypothetical protein
MQSNTGIQIASIIMVVVGLIAVLNVGKVNDNYIAWQRKIGGWSDRWDRPQSVALRCVGAVVVAIGVAYLVSTF